VIAGNAIAVRLAAQQRGSDNAARLIAGTRRARKGDSIIVTANATIDNA
jgi:hypothetical protein